MGKASREYFRNYYENRKKQYIEILGGECTVCGAKEELQFDHIDPSTKSFPIGKLMNFSKEKVVAELEKCQLLCKDCHLQKSIQEGSIPERVTEHGKLAMYQHSGCRCDLCREANRLHCMEYRKNKKNSEAYRNG